MNHLESNVVPPILEIFTLIDIMATPPGMFESSPTRASQQSARPLNRSRQIADGGCANHALEMHVLPRDGQRDTQLVYQKPSPAPASLASRSAPPALQFAAKRSSQRQRYETQRLVFIDAPAEGLLGFDLANKAP